MRIDWRSRRVRIAAIATLAGLLAWSIANGALWDWDMWDYIGWWVLVPLLVLLFAALITFLVRAWGPKKD